MHPKSQEQGYHSSPIERGGRCVGGAAPRRHGKAILCTLRLSFSLSCVFPSKIEAGRLRGLSLSRLQDFAIGLRTNSLSSYLLFCLLHHYVTICSYGPKAASFKRGVGVAFPYSVSFSSVFSSVSSSSVSFSTSPSVSFSPSVSSLLMQIFFRFVSFLRWSCHCQRHDRNDYWFLIIAWQPLRISISSVYHCHSLSFVINFHVPFF